MNTVHFFSEFAVKAKKGFTMCYESFECLFPVFAFKRIGYTY